MNKVNGQSGAPSLAMRPDGLAGRAFGKVMEVMNTTSYRETLDVLVPLPGEHVLEIGFGTGKFAALLLGAVAGAFVAGVDPSATMVAVANSRRGIREHPERVDLQEGTAEHLAWPNGRFDAVVALHSFQFWPDPARALAEIRRVLKPGGRLVLTLRDHAGHPPDWLPNPVSRSADEVSGLLDLLGDAGFVGASARVTPRSTRIVSARVASRGG